MVNLTSIIFWENYCWWFLFIDGIFKGTNVYLAGGNSNIFLNFHPENLGKWSNLTSIFFKWVGKNHQLVNVPYLRGSHLDPTKVDDKGWLIQLENGSCRVVEHSEEWIDRLIFWDIFFDDVMMLKIDQHSICSFLLRFSRVSGLTLGVQDGWSSSCSGFGKLLFMMLVVVFAAVCVFFLVNAFGCCLFQLSSNSLYSTYTALEGIQKRK